MRRTLTRVTVAGSAVALGVGLLAPAAAAHDRDGRGGRGVDVQSWDRQRDGHRWDGRLGDRNDRWDGARGIDPARVAAWREAKRAAAAERAAAWQARVEQHRAAVDAAVAERRAAKDAAVAERQATKEAAVAQRQAQQQATAAAQLESFRSNVLSAIDAKVTVLGQVEARVSASTVVPEDDKAAIVAGIRSCQANLADVRAQVAGATTGQEVASAIHTAWDAYALGHGR